MGKKLNASAMEGKPKLGKSLKKSTQTFTTKKKKMKEQFINPMRFYLRFPHISEKIFQQSNKDSIKNSRKVCKSWQNCIDNKNILWRKIVKSNNCNEVFLSACKNGHFKMVEMLVDKNTQFNQSCNFVILMTGVF